MNKEMKEYIEDHYSDVEVIVKMKDGYETSGILEGIHGNFLCIFEEYGERETRFKKTGNELLNIKDISTIKTAGCVLQ